MSWGHGHDLDTDTSDTIFHAKVKLYSICILCFTHDPFIFTEFWQEASSSSFGKTMPTDCLVFYDKKWIRQKKYFYLVVKNSIHNTNSNLTRTKWRLEMFIIHHQHHPHRYWTKGGNRIQYWARLFRFVQCKPCTTCTCHRNICLELLFQYKWCRMNGRHLLVHLSSNQIVSLQPINIALGRVFSLLLIRFNTFSYPSTATNDDFEFSILWEPMQTSDFMYCKLNGGNNKIPIFYDISFQFIGHRIDITTWCLFSQALWINWSGKSY